jgi:hypothetical protein
MAWKKEFAIVKKENLHLTLINHFHSMSMISLIFVILSFFFLPTIYCETFGQKNSSCFVSICLKRDMCLVRKKKKKIILVDFCLKFNVATNINVRISNGSK